MMNRNQKKWGVLMASLFFMVFSITAYTNNMSYNDEMSAAVAPSLYGEKFVKVYGWASYNYVKTVMLISENGTAYTTQDLDDYTKDRSYKSAEGYQPLIDNQNQIIKNINKVSVGKINYYGNNENSTFMLLQNDGSLYVWGDNSCGQYGNGTTSNVKMVDEAVYAPDSNKPVKVIPQTKDGTIITGIIDIVAGNYNTALLTENGDVYIAGDNQYGNLGNGTVALENEQDLCFTKANISNVKKLISGGLQFLALDTNGDIYIWGKNYNVHSSSSYGYEPTKLDGYNNIVDLAEPVGIPDLWPTYAAIDADGKVYYDILKVGSGYLEGDFSSLGQYDRFIVNYNGKIGMLVDNKLYYTVYESRDFKPVLLEGYEEFTGNEKVVDYIVAGTEWLIIDEEGTVYYGESEKYTTIYPIVPIIKKSLAVSGTVTGTEYLSEQKTKDNVTLSYVKSEALTGQVTYKSRDLVNNGGYSSSVNINTDEKVTVMNNENGDGNRVYKEYVFEYNQDGIEVNVPFIVDIYYHEFDTKKISVKMNGTYSKNQPITWEAGNGLSDNIVTATLTANGKDPIEIESGYVAGEITGNKESYTLRLVDEYGNKGTYEFDLVDAAAAVSMDFTANKDLKYGKTNTIKDGELGKASLVYEQGETASAIDSTATTKIDQVMKDGTTDITADGFFEVKVDSSGIASIKALKNVPAGTYDLYLTGKDQNGVDFEHFKISFTVEKADNPMKWNTDSVTAQSKGIYYKDALTVGVSELPDEIKTVKYKITDNANVSITDQGVVTVSKLVSDPMSFTVQAVTEETDNYQAGTLSLNVSITKRPITLKVSPKTNKIELGKEVPEFEVTATQALPDGVTLPKATGYSLYDKEGNPVDTIIKAGEYHYKPEYTDSSFFDDYKITWTYEYLTVTNVIIDDTNKGDFYELTLKDGTSYTPGSWTNQHVIIKPKHTTFTDMYIEAGGTSDTTTYTNDHPFEMSTEGDQTVKLSFQNSDGACADASISNIKIDLTAPVMNQPPIVYKNTKTSDLQKLLRELTFNQFFGSKQTATFLATDQGGSELDHYHYQLFELDDDGNKLSTTPVKEDDQAAVDLEINHNYLITVTAYDTAGNSSKAVEEKVKLDDSVAEITVDATRSDTKEPYEEVWTNSTIDIKLSSEEEIVSWFYQVADGAIEPLEGDTLHIPNTEIINNVTYTFIGEAPTGIKSTKTIQILIDPVKPVFDLTATSQGAAYESGAYTESDVELIIQNDKPNISNVTYYYCEDQTISETSPVNNQNWKLFESPFTVTEGGSKAFYVKAVSGAGTESDIIEFETNIHKKNYTDIKVTATSKDKPYQSNEWTNKDVIMTVTGGLEDQAMINGYEYTVTDGKKPDNTNTWTPISKTGNEYQITASKEQKNRMYWFRVDESGAAHQTSFSVNIDKTPPTLDDPKITYVNTDGLSELLNSLTFGHWFNKAVKVELTGSDNLSDKEELTFEYMEVINNKEGSWNSYTKALSYGDQTNLKIKARVIDQAGNMSEMKESGLIQLDLEDPKIIGVTDKSTYYVPHKIHLEDAISGISTDSYIKYNGKESEWTKDTIVKEIGEYTVYAKDNAGNDIEVSFTIKQLPNPDDLTDQDKDLIDDIIKDYEENKDHMSDEDQKDMEDWIDKAENQLKKYVNELKEPETNIIISGLDDTKFEEDVKLIVETITEQYKATELHLEKVSGLSEQSKLQEAFDIYLKKGTEIIPLPENGKVKVKIPYTLPRQAMKNMNLVCIDEQNQTSIVSYKIEETDGASYITFETDDLSNVYGLVADVKDTWNDQELNIDTDKDGKPDVNIDYDGDGIPDINIDLDGDLIPDLDIDVDGDGIADLNIDTDDDGIADDMIYKLETWKPETDCEVKGFTYDTMGSLQDIVDQLKKDKEGQGSKDPEQPDDPQDGNDDQNGNDGSGNEPEEPATTKPPVKGTYTGTSTGGAITGDETNLVMYMGIGLSALGILTSLFYKRKEE